MHWLRHVTRGATPCSALSLSYKGTAWYVKYSIRFPLSLCRCLLYPLPSFIHSYSLFLCLFLSPSISFFSLCFLRLFLSFFGWQIFTQTSGILHWSLDFHREIILKDKSVSAYILTVIRRRTDANGFGKKPSADVIIQDSSWLSEGRIDPKGPRIRELPLQIKEPCFLYT